MKYSFFLLFVGLITLSVSCKNDNAVREDAANSLNNGQYPAASTPAAPSAAPAMPTAPATASAGGVQHYICPKNCAGSGGAAQANCPVCGTAYIHNQAFHGQAAPAAPSPTATLPAQPTTEPAQNAAGVWHYTCAKGCAGGAGSAAACSSCGGMLAHNAAYHSN